MKIAFFEIEDWERVIIEDTMKEHELFFSHESLTDSHVDLIKEYEVLSVFIHSVVDAKRIASLSQLRFIATRSTGYDHIDLAVAEERGIGVANVPSYGEHTVAEHTFALMLSISRNIHRTHVRRLRNNFSIEGLKGFDLQGKTLGVIGTGKIGLHVIQIARAFEMRVVAFDVFPNEEQAIKLGYVYADLSTVLGQSDIITLHAPYTPSTYHLINKETIQQIKPGAILINTARGELVDNEALILALNEKILRGCGLDVIEGEELVREEKALLYDGSLNTAKMAELVKDHILLGRDEVVYTPHIAFFSEEALRRILTTTLENINSYVEGKRQNQVVFERDGRSS